MKQFSETTSESVEGPPDGLIIGILKEFHVNCLSIDQEGKNTAVKCHMCSNMLTLLNTQNGSTSVPRRTFF